ncbi:MAG: hypothetical protein FWH29_00155 [Methanobrevibacter sp.]|nr:hypothetical protein [Methanobrevibacter sp.]
MNEEFMKKWRNRVANEDSREKDFRRLLVAPLIAETPEEKKIAEENLKKFENENKDLVDAIHTNKWTAYGP